MEARIVQASIGDALHIAGRLREADVDEIVASSGLPPDEILPDNVTMSKRAYCVYSSDEKVLQPLCLFGLMEHPESAQVGIPWMVATDLLSEKPSTFLRHCRWFIDQFNSTYPVLTNAVDERNKLHRRWLKWCGFTFTERLPEWGVAKLPFWRVERIRDNV